MEIKLAVQAAVIWCKITVKAYSASLAIKQQCINVHKCHCTA
jgi:hypothetical protein